MNLLNVRFLKNPNSVWTIDMKPDISSICLIVKNSKRS